MSVGSTEARAQMTAADIDAVYRVVDDARRNFLITDAYHRLSTDMKRLIGPHGSWCTFSTWSSRTIGYFIRGDIDPVTEHWLAGLPGVDPVRRAPARAPPEPADQPLAPPGRPSAPRAWQP